MPLIVAAIPFVARMVESSLEELDRGVIEAAKAMGASDLQIILHVCLPEAVPSIIRGVSITAITLVGYSAMAGAVGGRGLGGYRHPLRLSAVSGRRHVDNRRSVGHHRGVDSVCV